MVLKASLISLIPNGAEVNTRGFPLELKARKNLLSFSEELELVGQAAM